MTEPRLGEVVGNLVDNAIKFSTSARSPSVVITAMKDGNYAKVKVMDNGPGIASNLMPKLFTKTFLTSESGTGLGLYVSRLVVEVHGGKIWAENNAGIPGASFIFTLPLVRSRSEKMEKMPERKSKASEPDVDGGSQNSIKLTDQ